MTTVFRPHCWTDYVSWSCSWPSKKFTGTSDSYNLLHHGLVSCTMYTLHWQVNGKAPTRAYHTSTLHRHELWIFGGVYPRPDPNPDGCSNDIHIFSPIMQSWYSPLVQGEKPLPRSGSVENGGFRVGLFRWMGVCLCMCKIPCGLNHDHVMKNLLVCLLCVCVYTDI